MTQCFWTCDHNTCNLNLLWLLRMLSQTHNTHTDILYLHRFYSMVRDAVHIHPSSQYGRGSGPILLAKLSCSPSSQDFSNCTHSEWGSHNCTHDQDVGLDCMPGMHWMLLIKGFHSWTPRDLKKCYHFADDLLKSISLTKIAFDISWIKFPWNLFSKRHIDQTSPQVNVIMAWYRTGDKPWP